MADDLPTFDGPRFSRWLRRWKEAEGLDWTQIAQRSGIHISTLHQLARGAPQGNARRLGQTTIDPRITSVARLARGLGLEFAYVASKAGLTSPREGDRWAAFNAAERRALAAALTPNTDPAVEQLLGELLPHVHTDQEITTHGNRH